MDLYPLNLVLAVALASATIFLGSLPTRLIGAPVFVRQVLWAGLAWMAVALASSSSIRHFHVVIGLVCLISWWKLRGGHALSGKLWLAAASALGISLGVVLILAVRMNSWPWLASQPIWIYAALLLAIYPGGIVIGLAYMLYVFTRRETTRAGLPGQTVDYLAHLLVILTLLRAAILVLAFGARGTMNSPGGPTNWTEYLFTIGPSQLLGALIFACTVLVLPSLAALARRKSRSPAPSTAGPVLLILCVVGLITETLVHGLGF